MRSIVGNWKSSLPSPFNENRTLSRRRREGHAHGNAPLSCDPTRACGAALLAAVAACGAGRWPDPPPVDGSTYDTEIGNGSTSAAPLPLKRSVLSACGHCPMATRRLAPTRPDPLCCLPARRRSRREHPASGGEDHGDTSKRRAPAVGGRPVDYRCRGDAGRRDSWVASPDDRGGRRRTSGRRFVTASDENRVDARTMAAINTYPIDLECRVAARFEAFDSPRSIQVGDVRGGVHTSWLLGNWCSA